MKLENQSAIVTGGAKGIGRAVCELFAAEGARVAILDLDAEQGEAAAARLRSGGHDAAFFRCDVGDATQARQALDAAAARFGAPDILVNDAAWQLNKPLLETTDEEFDRVLSVNLSGTFRMTRDAAKLMIAAGKRGVIVNFSSTFAVVGSPGYIAYHASKGGVASFTRAAAIALMPHGIRVNAVAPGTTETPGLYDGARDTGDVEKGLRSFLALQPLKRFGRPEEIARVVLFLACGDSAFVYGSNLMADGGYTIV